MKLIQKHQLTPFEHEIYKKHVAAHFILYISLQPPCDLSFIIDFQGRFTRHTDVDS